MWMLCRDSSQCGVVNSTKELVAQQSGAAVANVGAGWSSQRIAREHPCGGANSAFLVRRSVNTFWFQQCARRLTDYNTLAAELNSLVGAPPSLPKPMNIILRSGLFFSPAIKAAARDIRLAIGGPYASMHVRRSDKLAGKSTEAVINGVKVSIPAACNPEDCKTRDLQTRPDAIARTLQLWMPKMSRVYVGSTEPPSFFAPLLVLPALLCRRLWADPATARHHQQLCPVRCRDARLLWVAGLRGGVRTDPPQEPVGRQASADAFLSFRRRPFRPVHAS